MSGSSNYVEMGDVSKLLLLSSSSFSNNSDSIITKSRSSSASSTNSLSNNSSTFLNSSNNKSTTTAQCLPTNFKSFYSRNPSEIEIIHETTKISKCNINLNSKQIPKLIINKNDNDIDFNILTPQKQDNEPIYSHINVKKSDKSSNNLVSDSLSYASSFTPSTNFFQTIQNKNFNNSNSNINEINQLRTGALVKNLRKKFSPDENNNNHKNNNNTNTRYLNSNTGLSYRSQQQLPNYNYKINPNNSNTIKNKYLSNEQKKQESKYNLEEKEEEQANQKQQAQRSSSTNNLLLFVNYTDLNKKFKSEKNLFINNVNSNCNNNNSFKTRMNKTNSKSNNNLNYNNEVNGQIICINKKIDESDVFENVHIKDRISMFMSNTNSNGSSTNLNSKPPVAVKKQIADRVIFGGSVNNLLSLNTLPPTIHNSNDDSCNKESNNSQKSKFVNTDEISNDSANSTFSEDSSLLEINSNSSKHSNNLNEKNTDISNNVNVNDENRNDDEKQKLTSSSSILFDSISFNTIKFEENYVKIKQAFNDLRADNQLIESLLTDIRNKVKEAYFSIDSWESEEDYILDEHQSLFINDNENMKINSNKNQIQLSSSSSSSSSSNEEDSNSISKKMNNNNNNNDLLLSSHDNDDYFYYTAHSKRDMTVDDNSNLEEDSFLKSLMTNNEEDVLMLNEGEGMIAESASDIKKSSSILSSISSSSTNATVSSDASSTKANKQNDRVVLIRHKF